MKTPSKMPLKELAWQVDEQLSRLQFNRALESIWNVIQTTDQYIESQQPWKLAKDSSNRARLEQPYCIALLRHSDKSVIICLLSCPTARKRLSVNSAYLRLASRMSRLPRGVNFFLERK